MLQIKICNPNEIYAVRHQVLRKNKPFETAFFDGDDLKTTLHFGLFWENEIIGVISGFKKSNNLFESENQCQVRGMAILDLHQKKGYGNELLKYLENYYKNQNYNLIWFNARKNAVPFYEKMGYKTIGTLFDIIDIGPHYIMYKDIK